MFNSRSRNIFINKKNSKTRTQTDDSVLRLAEYYTRVFADTLEHMHLSEERKAEALNVANREYNELVSA